ncbi:hypothetical protein KC19_VG013700 [Ceratodon purpureus]|uniref:Uncharacterized protein n=1 Tax=Ceratodon purpureus TaxID=3225 RepID=A0A8T0HKX1_CERPU|nr:hypothetical protein KC19_VG013700 [Ceratodon purpureus]
MNPKQQSQALAYTFKHTITTELFHTKYHIPFLPIATRPSNPNFWKTLSKHFLRPLRLGKHGIHYHKTSQRTLQTTITNELQNFKILKRTNNFAKTEKREKPRHDKLAGT